MYLMVAAAPSCSPSVSADAWVPRKQRERQLHCFTGPQIQHRPSQSLPRRHRPRRSLCDAQALLRLQLCFLLLEDCPQWTGKRRALQRKPGYASLQGVVRRKTAQLGHVVRDSLMQSVAHRLKLGFALQDKHRHRLERAQDQSCGKSLHPFERGHEPFDSDARRCVPCRSRIVRRGHNGCNLYLAHLRWSDATDLLQGHTLANRFRYGIFFEFGPRWLAGYVRRPSSTLQYNVISNYD